MSHEVLFFICFFRSRSLEFFSQGLGVSDLHSLPDTNFPLFLVSQTLLLWQDPLMTYCLEFDDKQIDNSFPTECPSSDLAEAQCHQYVSPGNPLKEEYHRFQDSLF